MMPQLSIKGFALACIAAGGAGFSPTFTDRARRRPIERDRRRTRPRLLPSSSSSVALRSSWNAVVDYAATIDVAEDARREISSMEGWAAERGVQRAEGFALVEEGREVRAAAMADVVAGSPILYVPEELILTSGKAIAELRCAEMEDAELVMEWNGAESEYRYWYLMLKILKEVQEGRDSPWFPWLNSLPRYFSNAASMTDFCLQCLPPLMRRLANEERENQVRLSKESIENVPFLGDGIKNHRQDFVKWAYQIAYTRSVETEDGDLRIVPVADYFDHTSADYVEVQSSYDDAGNYYAYAPYDVEAGTPLRIRYADPRNPSHLLARYGFLDEESPATYCKLLPETVNEDMTDLGYAHDRMLFYRTGEVADEVWDIFLYQHLSSTNIDDQQALMWAHRTGDSETKLALHEKHYAATSAALLEHVDSFVDEIDRLIKKAETIGVDDPNSIYVRYEHPRLPLIHRHNLFVRETFANVRSKYSEDPDVSWRDATKVTVQECDDTECAIAECVQNWMGEWECEGGLGPNWDGSERTKTKTIIAAQ
mmetsp:Transcript_200/g.460  ORF Transcript_200/g.460 Transcript_200/m.460 type:complete len:540 (+) Transcript_200:83-1702(+)